MKTRRSIEPLEARIAPTVPYAVATGDHLVSFHAETLSMLDSDSSFSGLQTLRSAP